MAMSVSAAFLGGMLLLAGASGGVIATTQLFTVPPPVCTIDPLVAEELARQSDLLARIVNVVEAWEGRQQVALREVDRRRQRLNQDAIRPGQPTGLDGLPTRMEGK